MKKQLRLYLYLFACVLLLFTESLIISLQVDAQSLPQTGILSKMMVHMGGGLRWITISAAIFVSLIFCFRKEQITKLIPQTLASPLYWLIHAICYVGLLYVSIQLFDPDTEQVPLTLSCAWLLFVFLSLLSWIKLIHPIRHISAFILTHFTFLIVAGIIGFLLIVFTHYADNLWKPLSAITLHSSSALLTFFFSDNVFVDAPNKLLGLKEFIVHIAPACSGLEGLITSLGVTGIYLIALRRELAFPVAFLLLPLAVILSIILNTVRITVLLTIGAFISPDIAVEGFHSVAGWISAAIVAFLVIFVFSSLSIFDKKTTNKANNASQQTKEIDNDSRLAWAILIPFIITLVSALLSKIVVENFDYLYPLKVIIGGGALFYFWQHYQLKLPKKWLEPTIAGAFIAIFWVILVTKNPEYDLFFSLSLTDMTQKMVIAWFIFRFIGFWLLAPIIEELVFRGYILARLSKQPLTIENQLTLSIPALVISAVIFGALHNSFVAGFVAGVIFAIVRYRTQSLSEPILSHMIANILVAAWAIKTEQWVLL